MDLLLGNLSVPKVDDVFDDIPEEGKRRMKVIELNEIVYTELIFLLMLRLAMARLLFTLSKDARQRIILVETPSILGRNLRINMHLFLCLQWLSWTSNSGNYFSTKAKTLKFGLLNWRIFMFGLIIWVQAFQKINS
jgi:hypothetical protein